MIYLDEPIYYNVTDTTKFTDGLHTFYVYQGSTLIYVGQAYAMDKRIKIYLNDIFANYVPDYYSVVYTEVTSPFVSFRVVCENNSSSYTVYMIYRYPNKRNEYVLPTADGIMVPYYESNLLPVMPWSFRNVMAVSAYITKLTNYIEVYQNDNNYGDIGNYHDDSVSYVPLDDFSEDLGTGRIDLVHQDLVVPVGYLEDCHRYYLLWVDRKGAIQCQPFQASTYTENIERVNVQNEIGVNKNVYYSVTSKWELSTGFINEKYYPAYESLLISKDVYLYDTQEDQRIKVLVEDTDYTEKTFRNQDRQFFNFTINVVKDTNQNIIA